MASPKFSWSWAATNYLLDGAGASTTFPGTYDLLLQKEVGDLHKSAPDLL